MRPSRLVVLDPPAKFMFRVCIRFHFTVQCTPQGIYVRTAVLLFREFAIGSFVNLLAFHYVLNVCTRMIAGEHTYSSFVYTKV